MKGDARRDIPAVPASVPDVWRDNDNQVCAWGETGNGEYAIHFPSSASFYFDEDAGPVRAFRAIGDNSIDLDDLYRRSVAPFFLYTRGLQVIHASAVELNGMVMAICGRSGAGKSTLAYGLHRRGFRLWADDFVAWDRLAGQPITRHFPCSPRLLPSALNRLGPAADKPSPPKSEQTAETAHLAHIVILDPANDAEDEVLIQDVSSAEAFDKVLNHAFCFPLSDQDLKMRMVERYLELVEIVPVSRLTFRHDFEQLDLLFDRIENLFNKTD